MWCLVRALCPLNQLPFTFRNALEWGGGGTECPPTMSFMPKSIIFLHELNDMEP
jgi:hypothetical protein